MEKNLLLFKELTKLFEKNGFSLFCVGGTVRNYLLNIPLNDMDLVTNATPSEMIKFIKDADFTFSKYGSIKYVYKSVKFDITTFRRETKYIDSRHPAKVQFVSSPRKDFKRRDLTINALYLDKNFKVIDYIHGQKDLKGKIIKMIGNPYKRIKEDPLRILRIIRFALDFDFNIDTRTYKAVVESTELLKELNPEKIKQEIKKIKCKDNVKILKLFNEINISNYLSVIK